jgi:hypothetical protein
MFGIIGLQTAGEERVRAVIDSVFSQPRYRWQQAIDPFAPLRRAWLWLNQLFDSLRAESPLAYRMLIALLVLVLAAVLLHAAWVAYRTVRGGTAGEIRSAGAAAPVRDAAWFAREAARLEAAGRYAEAMQADFLRLVLELDARRLVRFHPSRTPNEYSREPTLSAESRRELAALVRRLYAHAFAGLPCRHADLLDWRSRAATDRYAPA